MFGSFGGVADEDSIDTTLPLAAVLPPLPRNNSASLIKDLLCLLKTGVDVGAHLEDVFCCLPPLSLETVHIRPPTRNEAGPTLQFEDPLTDVCLLSEIAMVS